MPLISTKSLVATGLFVLIPVSLIYTFHSSAGPIDSILEPTFQVPTSTASEHLFISRESLRKRAPAENADPGSLENLEFAKEDNWKGLQISNKCSADQKTRFQKGWIEAGYLTRLFKMSLEEIRYERALGDFLGHAWKTNGFAQRITDNFARIEALHFGGKGFQQTLEIYCDETDTPKRALAACEKNNCCDGSPDGKEGGYFYVKQGVVPVTYAIVLCPSYFEGKTVLERAEELIDSKLPNFDQVKQNVWALYPNIASTLLHLQLHLPFAPTHSLYIGDAIGYYNPTGSGDLASKSADQSTRTAENYAIAALAVAQIHIFGLEKAPSFKDKKDLELEQKEGKFKGLMGTAKEGSNGKEPASGPKPSVLEPETPGQKKAGLSPALKGNLSDVIGTGAGFKLPRLAIKGGLPKDLDKKVYKGIPSIH
ncbi:hypothetical protein TWF706_003913 [Orbilia oligospora]|nr:hypothetical protein TWF706_003913 [Orbilia oligospora]